MQKMLLTRKRYVLLFLLVTLAALSSMAQNQEPGTVNSTGSTSTENDIIYEWSVGELALVETMINNQTILTNGLLQPVLPIHMITETFVVFPTNILSANGDGVNDAWVIKDLEKFPDNEVRIFDRAGRVIYNVKNYQNTWTGNLGNVPLAEDAYYYVITLKKDGKTEFKKGFITIIKD
jgi:gliding motility-associated-like protein